ncbi:uncharacterized protein LOC111916489 [Lactuca sativa]|uniref:uncharacterized protein LOC111916489 n=1 Tax=Lactuca sativa TaxID=4236 RepID=UPI000CD994FE|nr:uncharacterized protein LOC111916489 [Lactuca sativa]
MTPMERRLLNASSGGFLPDKTPTKIRNLIKNMAEDSKHSSHDEKCPHHTLVVFALKWGTQQTCALNFKMRIMKKKKPWEAFLGQIKGHMSSHNVIRDGTVIKAREERNMEPRPPPQQPPRVGSSSMSLEDIVKSLATSTKSFQQETKASIKILEQQVSQLAQSMGRMESQGMLPSQTEKNPKHNACAITLRGGKSYEGPRIPNEEEEEKEIEVEEAVKEEERKNTSRLTITKREREDDEIMTMFRKVETNIPLSDAITQIPRYAKFLKELCTFEKKLKGIQTVKVGEDISVVLQKWLLKKCKDPGVFMVPCKMGNLFVPRVMLDLGASINVLPYTSYKTMVIGPLAEIIVIIQLADRSLAHPKGVLEDVLGQVNELVFPADFYVLDMGDDDQTSSSILFVTPQI